jgi:pimeloyl-ACP methyl ester carboxylesterase
MSFARLKDLNLHYQQHGRGEVLLLLHGLGSSSYDWEFQVPAFSKHFQVLAPCLRGFGDSDKPPGPYSIAQYASDVLGLLDHLGVERCHVLGFSMGGAIAFQMAVDRPERVNSLIVVNSQPSFELDHWRKHLMVITRMGMASVFGMDRMARYVAKRLFPLPEQKALRDRMVERHVKNQKASYLAALQALAGWSVKDRIQQLYAPTLVIAGEHDYSPLEEKRRYVQLIPNARLEVIKGSRHGTLFERPDEVNRSVLDFLLVSAAGELRKQA